MVPFRRTCCYVLLLLALGACSLEGGVRATPTPPPPATATTPPAPPPQGWRIGLTDGPTDLYPYSGQREAAPVLALLYPPPVLPMSPATGGPELVSQIYTGTGVLEQLPTVANGGVVSRTLQVYFDATGAVTTTVTEVSTQVTQLMVTYRWNPRLRWSDGQPVTAADSLFAYQVAQATPLTPETARRLELTADYEVLDEHTTRAYLRPGARDPDYLLTAWLPLPRHVLANVPLAEVPERLARRPLGYGPYVLEGWQSGELTLTRRQDAPAEYPEQVTFRLLDSLTALRTELIAGRVDVGMSERLLPDDLPFLQQDRRSGLLQVLAVPGPVWEHLDFNLEVRPFDDQRVRQAIASGTNRLALTAELFGGHATVLDSWISPDSWAYAPDVLQRYPYDVQRARQLLDEAGLLDHDGDGWRELAPGQPVTATLLTSANTPLRETIAQRFQQDMHTLGLSITLDLLPTSELYSPEGPLFRRRFQLALFGWLRGPEPDGAVLWSCLAIPSAQNEWSGNNFAGWCDLAADRAIRQASTSLDPERRRAAYREHQQHFSTALPVLPLFARPMLVLAQPNLQGLQPDPFAPLVWNIGSWQRGQR